MAKVQDTYNPVTGEYVKRISDYVELGGSKGWVDVVSLDKSSKRATLGMYGYNINFADWLNVKSILTDYTSKQYTYQDAYMNKNSFNFHTNSGGSLNINIPNTDTGFSETMKPTSGDWKAYFHGWKMANSDGSSPYYKSEIPYTPATWAEWTGSKTSGAVADSTGVTITGDGAIAQFFTSSVTNIKASTNYGILFNVPNSNILNQLYFGTVAYSEPFAGKSLSPVVGNNKAILTSQSSFGANQIKIYLPIEAVGKSIKLKDIRIFELPTGSQIETDFTNLSADELSAKYTFNGLCVKHWKKVTDGSGLTSTLPTTSYEGYTPYRLIYQLATPEISYLTPKATIPLYDTNTIVETNTPSDCRADVTVGYKLKDGVTAVDGDITAPTPDYMSAVNSVSEDGLKNGIVRSPNIVTNGDFSNGTTGWSVSLGVASIEANVGELTVNTNVLDTYGAFQTVVGAGIKYIAVDFFNAEGMTAVKLGNVNVVVSIPGNTWKRASTLYTGEGIMRFYGQAKESLTYKMRRPLIINLTTTFGAGNEPTKEQCDILFATWQDKASTQATLPTLRKIGTVADTYNPETGVLVQRIGKKVFDGTELTSISIGDGNSVVITKPIENLYYGNTYYSPFIGSHHMKMTGVPNVDWNKSINYGKGCVSTNSSLWLSVDNKKINTISEAQEWFAQQYANGTPVTVYYQLATPIVTTLTKTALPTYKPTTVIESDSTVKGDVSADYKLKVNATPVAGDFIASPECVNDIKDLGNSIDVVSSVGRRNLAEYTKIGIYLGGSNKGASSKYSINGTRITVNEQINDLIAFTITDVSSLRGKNITISAFSDLNTVTTYHKFDVGAQMNTTLTKNGNIHSVTIIVPNNASSLVFGLGRFPHPSTFTPYYLDFVKIEEGVTLSPWSPAPEDISYNTVTNGIYKTNILLSAPLRSLGAVKDRLFKDSDGKWKIERNIGERIIDGTETWSADNYRTGGLNYAHFTAVGLKPSTDVISNTFPSGNYLSSAYENVDSTTVVIFNVKDFRTGVLPTDSNGVRATKTKNAVVAMGTIVQYILATPTYETLSQELQTKLDNIPTFPEHNYVYTVANDNLQPTLHVDYKKLSWLKSRLLFNTLKIYNRNLTDDEMIQNYKIEKDRFGM